MPELGKVIIETETEAAVTASGVVQPDILAACYSDGHLTVVKRQPGVGKISVGLDVPPYKATCEIRVFLWAGDMIPVSQLVQFQTVE